MASRRSIYDKPDAAAPRLHLLANAEDNNEELDRLRKALFYAMKLNLTDRQREAILLYYKDGLKMSEIAKLWGVSSSAVSRHISRGKERISQVVPPL